MIRPYFFALLIAVTFTTCKSTKRELSTSIESIAANEEVASALQKFEGRGALTDNSLPISPEDALNLFNYPDDLSLELVLSEPQVVQPLFMNFDHKGRLWVVQYQQYPYPKGLKVMSIDNHLRVKFDKVPDAPPKGVKGADKITVYEDTDGDGKFDRATDAITGLNIATSVVVGRKKIWVLNPPYLIAFPDKDENGIPDGQPEVHLSGFGLEDTHAVANSLRWGPDGWLYGAQGSTTTAVISSKVSKNVAFKGQVIWRYHPEIHVFEVFAEGGGNTFYVEIDDKGRIFSGDNGYSRGMYYKQGAYYPRNLDKHGPYTNVYTFGQLPNMPIVGEKKRFTHAWLKYQSDALPTRYTDKIVAINPLQSFIQVSRFEESGSSFKNIDEEVLLKTTDKWFRPVDIKAGPDGALYIADWYDSRLSHVDARDTWHKLSGRIYRLKSKDRPNSYPVFDLTTYTNEQLIEALHSPNRWLRQQAQRVIGDRKDHRMLGSLESLLHQERGQIALEALWAIHLLDQLNDKNSKAALQHQDPFVRMWGVRLLGDKKRVNELEAKLLAQLAITEQHPEVRSQLVATAKRIQSDVAFSILRNLLLSNQDHLDPDIPLQTWWTIEAHLLENIVAFKQLWQDQRLWNNELFLQTITKNVSRRLVLGGSKQELSLLTSLLELAPEKANLGYYIEGIKVGLEANNIPLPKELLTLLQRYNHQYTTDVMMIGLWQSEESIQHKAIKMINDPQVPLSMKSSLISVLGKTKASALLKEVKPLLETSSPEIKAAVVQSLQNFEDNQIATTVLQVFPTVIMGDKALETLVYNLLTSRPAWTQELVATIEANKAISAKDIPSNVAQQLLASSHKEIASVASKLWPEYLERGEQQKFAQIQLVQKLLKSGEGNRENGKVVFMNNCGNCHRLFNEGRAIGPDLTGYDRTNIADLVMNTVDPNAYIREGYVLYQVETTDGRELVGRLVSQNGATITLQPMAGESIVLQEKVIKSKVALPTSLMPEGLLENMKEQEIRDLFAFISKLE